MSDHRQVWQTLSALLQRVEKSIDRPAPADAGGLTGLEQELRKLGKTQFKANALAEDQAARIEKALAVAQAAQEQNARLNETLVAERAAASQQDLLEAILPALDGLDHAIQSGKHYLEKRDMAASRPDLSSAQAVLVSPADRAMLAGWLDGLRLVRERFLAILETGQVTPIPTVGQSFDPYRHVAVGTTSHIPDGLQSLPNLIVSEERRGYQSPVRVLRYAEVIIYRP